jgi:hypothetical protein
MLCFQYQITLLQSGQTALSIAQQMGYISVVETLKVVTQTEITTTTTTTVEEKYKVTAPESMQETFLSDSEDEGELTEQDGLGIKGLTTSANGHNTRRCVDRCASKKLHAAYNNFVYVLRR